MNIAQKEEKLLRKIFSGTLPDKQTEQLIAERVNVVNALLDLRKKIEAKLGRSWPLHRAYIKTPEGKKEHEEYFASLSEEERKKMERCYEMLDITLCEEDRLNIAEFDRRVEAKRKKEESNSVMYRLGGFFGGRSKR